MRIAILGAGLAGIGAAYFLKQLGHDVYLVHTGDGGASEIPIGLCHPYPGRSGRPSLHAYEAMACTMELLQVAEGVSGTSLFKKGIVRDGWVPKESYPDVDGNKITSGLTVLMAKYVKVMRTLFVQGPLSDYDRIVYAMGAMRKDTGTHQVKGQVLIGKGMCRETTMRESGHASPYGDFVQIGSTYEHEFSSADPEMDVAKRDLQTKVAALCPEFEPIECRAGVRVSVEGTYEPIVRQLSETEFLFTGLGSRGLLYHAYYGKRLAGMV